MKKDHLCRLDKRLLVIPFVEKGPWIDGKLNDPAWKTAASYGRFLDATAYFQHRYDISSVNPSMFDPEPALAPAVPGTKVFLCHDATCLYAAFICHDPCPAKILRRDHGFGNYFNRLTREDCVYLWLDPVLEHVKPSVLEYIVNAAGQKSECIRGSYSGDYLSLMAWEGRATIGKDRWIAEVMLPLERLGLDAADKNVFGLNLGRGYRGDWRTHVLFKPDGDFLPGWAFAVLEGKRGKALQRSIARINGRLVELERQEQGISLSPSPGSPRKPGTHCDSNAMIGISAWGPDHQPTISVGRSDSYDRRWYGNELPVVTRRQVVDAAMSGDPKRLAELSRRACNDQYSAYQHFPAPKPVGQIIFFLPDGPHAGWQTDVSRGADGLVQIKAGCKAGKLQLRIYVHKRLNLIVAEGNQQGLDGRELKIRIYRHRDNPSPLKQPGYDYDADEKAGKNVGPLPAPAAGCEGQMAWVKQAFPAEATYPQGFEVCLAAVAPGTDPEIEVETEKTGLGTPAVDAYEGWVDPASGAKWGATHYRRQNATPGWSATLRLKLAGPAFRALFPVVSTNDGMETKAAAKECVDRALKFSSEDLETNSRQATPAERVGTYQYQQDLALSSVFSAKFCYADFTDWHGDNHFDEFYFDFIRRDPLELETFFQMVETNLPAARALAKEAFECRGAAWSVASFPRKFERLPTTNLDFDYCIECTGLVFQPFWQTYLYTMDREFLKRRAYPAIKEAALFYADYTTLEKDGLYHIWPCVSAEHITLQPYLRYNRDSQGALGACRYILNAAIEAARVLNVDHAVSRSWQNIVDHLAPYPVEETPEGPRFVDMAGARLMTEYNEFQPLSAVFFWDDIGLASPAEQIIVAKRTLKGLVRISTPQHWGHVYRTMIRLGMWPGGVIAGSEHLIQSHQGPLFLFPAVPAGYTGEFNDFRARGAFRVSAAMKKGRLTRVQIKSLAGEICRVDVSRFKRMPAVRCLETGACVKTAANSDRFLVFATIPGKTYALQL